MRRVLCKIDVVFLEEDVLIGKWKGHRDFLNTYAKTSGNCQLLDIEVFRGI